MGRVTEEIAELKRCAKVALRKRFSGTLYISCKVEQVLRLVPPWRAFAQDDGVLYSG
jgi:hypothetical protein